MQQEIRVLIKNSFVFILSGTLIGFLVVSLEVKIFIPLIVLIAFSTFYFSEKIFGISYSPVGIMSMAWLLPPLLNFLDPKWELTARTYLIILGSFFLFSLGSLMVVSNFKIYKARIKEAKVLPWSKDFIDKVIIVFFFIGTIGFLLNFLNILKAGGITLYFKYGLRYVESIFGRNTFSNYLYFLNMIVVPLVIFRHLFYGKKFSFIGLLSFSFLFFHGIRGTVLYSLLILFWVIILSRKKIRLREIFIFLIISFLVFSFVTIFRDPRGFFKSEFSFKEAVLYNLKRAYEYVASNYSNLQETLNNYDNFLLGKYTFGNITRILTLGKVKINVSFPIVDERFNVGTYLRDYFIDFGLIGALIFTFMIGSVTAWFFMLYLQRPTQRNLFVYSIICTMISATFWFNEFLRIQFIYFIVLIWAVDLLHKIYLFKREKQ
jgi:oligosaccharide repeat unit polymerase